MPAADARNRHDDPARKRAESDALFLSIGNGAIVTDEHGRISRINQAALDILGYREDELLGAWFPNTIVAETENGEIIPAIERPITNVFVTGKPISTRMTYRCKDGSRTIVYLTVSPVVLGGRPIGAIEVFRDITQEVELERAKDEFISLASHQLRTPASAVKQYAGMLLQGYAGDMTPEQLAMVQTIFDCNERQITIVNDLLKVAQVDAGKVELRPRIIDIADVVARVIDEQLSKFRSRRQAITYQRPDKPLHCYVDPQFIRMVIENIVDNASKYTPEGKPITVRVAQGKKMVRIIVADEGVGIDRQLIPQIFQKFMRLPNVLSHTVGGTGLGLYWAKKIVDLHGGTITVNSQAGKGTTFTIRIPIQAA